MKAREWIVTRDDTRSGERNGERDTCFFCQSTLGQEHQPECVIRSRTVVVRYVIETLRPVPEAWEPHSIDFHMNDSSWCASNLLEELREIYPDGPGVCLCGDLLGEYLREATTEDEERRGYSIQNKSIVHNAE
jgi:hypothetical protein